MTEGQARNFARWPEVAPNGGEYADAGLIGWEAEVSHLANWLLARMAWVDSKLIAAPTLATQPGQVSAGSQVTLDSNQSGGNIYYTLGRGLIRGRMVEAFSSNATLYTGR